jgi:hypothetical protein
MLSVQGLLDQFKKTARFVVYPKNHLFEGELIDRPFSSSSITLIQRVRGLPEIQHFRPDPGNFPRSVLKLMRRSDSILLAQATGWDSRQLA